MSNLQKVTINPGNTVCVTKMFGKDQEEIKDGEQFIGKLVNDIEVNTKIAVDAGSGGRLDMSMAIKIFVSYTSIIVRTKNSVYLIEKLLS